MRKIIAIALTLVGTPLELYFYWFRFTNEGMAGWVAIIAGLGLTVLLATFVYLSRDKRAWLFPALLVAAFDIISTSAGQSFASIQEAVVSEGIEMQAEDARWTREDADKEIARLDAEYESLTKQTEGLNSIEDRAKWKSAVASLDQAKNNNRALRDAQVARKEGATRSATAVAGIRKATIYSYYESLFKLPSKWIQFALHTFLSACLAAMPSVGVLLWPREKDRGLIEKALASSKKVKRNYARSRRRVEGKEPTEVEPNEASNEETLPSIEEALADLPDIVDPRQLGRALGMSHTPVYNAINKGELEPESMNPVRIMKENALKWASTRQGK